MVTYQLLNEFANIKAFTTSRYTVPGDNSPRFTGKPEHETKDNRLKLATILGIGAEQLVFPRQTHSVNVVKLTDFIPDELNDTDALVTNTPQICLCVQTADCVPILLYDPVNHAVAAVHAGWRGTVGQIVKTVVLKLGELYNSSSII
jgi:polyphenol oxidase